jgi:LmbE family N-acetylglucosaminyl deacetylase
MQPDLGEPHAQLLYRLRGLGMAGTVLHIGAHPDDEDIGLLAYLTHKWGVRAVYWSATRGEGGLNRINAYTGAALGVYRTWESLAARAVDGGECLFGPFYDFGYSKNAEEALAKWGHKALVREVVRAIRLVQPHILVSRWTGMPGDEHGQHQAVGQATVEAFEAAGDPNQFSELVTQGLAPWQPLKLYQSMGGDWQPGQAGLTFGQMTPALERDGVLRLNTGEFDPVIGMTYQERAWMAFNQHQTQGMGLAPVPGDFYYYFSLYRSLVPVPTREITIFDGLDPTLTGLADHPGSGSRSLRQSLEAVTVRAREALQRYRVEDPMEASTSLLEGLSLLRAMRENLASEDLTGEVRHAIDNYVARKIVDFEEVIALCIGLQLEGLGERARIIPGQRCRVSTHLWNHRAVCIDQATFTLRVPEGWDTRSAEPEVLAANSGPLGPSATFDVIATEMADLTCPYWLATPSASYVYHWPEGEPCSRPFGPAPVQIECDVTLGQHRISLRKDVVHREGFPGGFRELPLAVIPPISLHPTHNQVFLPVRETIQRRAVRSQHELKAFLGFLQESLSDQHLELQVVVRNNSHQAVEGILELVVPPGWKVAPERVTLSLTKPDDATTVRLTVTVPASTPEGHYPLRYNMRYGERDYGVVVTPVRMGASGGAAVVDGGTCVKEEFFIAPAQVMVHLINARFTSELKYAYVQGAKEELVEVLTSFGMSFHLITDAEMGQLDLSRFDAVVIGPNAYVIRHELRNNAARFLDYVKRGGTLIVQYQGYGYQNPSFTPYPFQYHQPHDRVTHEDAPVTILDPDHPLLRVPNAINSHDFDDWIRDRGLYFFGQWDKRYHPLLACSDQDEEPHAGGLLACQYGQGSFLYVGYSLFRQLPAGVPGAFRLFANILALPAARILQRIDFLKHIPLFSTLAEDQLDAVARVISERWEEDGMYICRPGELGQDLYIVYWGAVEVVAESEGQQHAFVAKAGNCIGQLGMMGQSIQTTSIRAQGDAHLFVIEDSQFQALLRQHPDVAIEVIKFLANRLHHSEAF